MYISSSSRSFDVLSNLSNTIVPITGTTSLTASSFGKMHYCSGTTANYNVVMPDPSTGSGKFIGFHMSPSLAKIVTLAPHLSEPFDGITANRPMWANEVAILYCDGTKWAKFSGKSVPMSCVMTQSAGGNTSVVDRASPATVIPCRTIVSDTNTLNLMSDTTAGRINIVRSGYYVVSALDKLGSYGVGGVNPNGIVLACVMQNVVQALSSSPAYGSNVLNFGFGSGSVSGFLNCAIGDHISLGAIQIGGGISTAMTTNGQDGTTNQSIAALEIPSW